MLVEAGDFSVRRRFREIHDDIFEHGKFIWQGHGKAGQEFKFLKENKEESKLFELQNRFACV